MEQVEQPLKKRLNVTHTSILPVSYKLASIITVLEKRHLSSNSQPCAHKATQSLGGLSDYSFLSVAAAENFLHKEC